MNIGLMGMMFGGTIAEVMSDASEDIKAIIGKVAK
jgi:dienelactone hydrolase